MHFYPKASSAVSVLLRWAILLIASLSAASAIASFPVPSGKVYYSAQHGTFSDASSACLAYITFLRANLKMYAPYTPAGQVETTGTLHCKVQSTGNGSYNEFFQIQQGANCPANSVKVGATCQCNTDHAERLEGGVYSCVPVIESDCSKNGMIFNSTLTGDRVGRAKGPLGKFSEGAITCFGTPSGPNGSGKGCKHMFTGEWGFKDADGADWTQGESWAFTEMNLKDPRLKGELSCDLTDNPTPDEEPAVTPPDSNCKDGYKGQVNGKDVCIEPWTGETQGVDFGITKGPDGSTTNTKNNINCKGDQCTITETNTIKDPDGKTIKETTSTTSNVNRRAYCAKNPKSSVCGGQEDPSGATKGQDGKGGGGGGGDSGELDGKYTEIGAPKLYEKKFENGVKGVWDKHAADLKSSSIGGLAGKLFPNYGDGGSAPTYMIDLNLGGKFNFGTYDLNFDPRVWLALKAFTILCALAVARKLVFGG